MNTLIFGAVGDVHLSEACADNIRCYGYAWPFERMLPALSRVDLLFGNLESVIIPHSYPDAQIDPLGLVTKLDAVPALQKAGFACMSLANNHILDAGEVGMLYTKRLLDEAGIANAGIGKTQKAARAMTIIERKGLTVGFLCYCEDNNYSLSTAGSCHAYYTLPSVLEDIARNRGNVDALVVSIHADLEFSETPSPQRRAEFRKIAEAGATLVLGHHPHVPQGVERIGRSLVVYSLGNCYAPAHSKPYLKAHPHTDHSFLLVADIAKDSVEGFRRIPFQIEKPPEERPVPLEGPRKDATLTYYSELDRKACDDGVVIHNWRVLASKKLDEYLEYMKTSDSREILLNYLGRLLFVEENRRWVNEVMEMARKEWMAQTHNADIYHRPHYVLTRRSAPVPRIRSRAAKMLSLCVQKMNRLQCRLEKQ